MKGIHIFRTCIVLICNTILVQTPSLAQTPDWQEITACSWPQDRSDSAIAYDEARAQAVLFAGFTTTRQQDTWIWDGFEWNQAYPATNPPNRFKHSMAYDSWRQVVVMFGGGGNGVKLNDTWEWNGTNWFLKGPATVPPARESFGMAFDASRGKVVMFGGFRGVGGSLNDTWEWDGVNWIQVSPATTTPSARNGHSMAYDASIGKVVMFGGFSGARLNDTWTWDGTDWTEIMTSSSPPVRNLGRMVYDSVNQRILLHGGLNTGSTYLNDLWEFDGASDTWTEIAPATIPQARCCHMLVYDPSIDELLLYGGSGGTGNNLVYGDIQLYTARTVPTPCVNPSASPSNSPSASPSATDYGTPSPSQSPTVTASASMTPSMSATPSPTPSISMSPSVSPSISPSASESPSASLSPGASPSESPSVSASATASSSESASPSASPSIGSSQSPTPSESPSASLTSSPSATPSETPSVPASVTPSPTGSPALPPSSSASASPSESASPFPSGTPGALGGSPEASVSASPSSTPSVAPGEGSGASGSPSSSPAVPPALGYVSGFVTSGGSGLAGVLVSAELFGSVITNEQGYFEFPQNSFDYEPVFTVSRTGYSFSMNRFTESEAIIQSLAITAEADKVDRSGCTASDMVERKVSLHSLVLELLSLGEDTINANPTGNKTARIAKLRTSAKKVLSTNLSIPEVFYSCQGTPNCLPLELNKVKAQLGKNAVKLNRKVKRLISSTFSERLGRKTLRLADRTLRGIKKDSKKYPKQTSICQ